MRPSRRLISPVERLASRAPRARLAAMAPRARLASRSSARGVAMAAAPRNPVAAARHGKYAAAAVVAAGAYGLSQRSGRGVDKSRGRPTGMYGY